MMFNNSSKRGQSAAGAAVLVAVITSLLIMFIILIPPEEREKLLDDNGVSDTSERSTTGGKNLLLINPGRIDFLAQDEVEHPLPVINVYTRLESQILAEKNIAYSKRGIFSEERSEFRFSLPDLDRIENVLLNFKIVDISGNLIITLNDEIIFNSAVAPGSTKPISIPKNSFKADNIIFFSVSSPGLAFWRTNELSLENIQVIADVTDVGAQFSRNVFLVSETEKKNLERVKLRFQPGCLYNQVGKLSIEINGVEIYNAVPDCDLESVPLEFSPEIIRQGENEVVFTTEKGSYVLSHILIQSELKEVEFPTYYFDITQEQFEDIQDNSTWVRLGVKFVDIVNTKLAEINVNGHRTTLDTKDVSYTLDLSEDIEKGSNSIQIKPKKTLEVRELRVDIVR